MIPKIIKYLNKFDLDLRKTNNGRFIDQKVTPDVLSFVADCIINFTSENIEKEFCARDIWEYEYFNKNIEMIFGKPPLNKETMENEYNKVAGQPIKTLEYANILKTTKKGRKNYFKIKNLELLEYISIKDKNAYLFLTIYLRKVLSDSGFIKYIDDFLKKALKGQTTKENFNFLKEKYEIFIIGNTKINGKTEVRRIFTKVLNIFSAENNTPGTIKGHLSKRNIYFQDLMYNRINFRDLEKEKGISRTEAKISKKDQKAYEEYNDYLVRKAINFIKKKYKESEIKDSFGSGPAVYVHHIFPKNEFPEIAHYLENLIKLTSEQHYTHAHPKGNTQIINKDYQLVCLLSKSESIEKSLIKGEFYYSKPNLIFVINAGLNLENKNKLSNKLTFQAIKNELKTKYKIL
ncbi:hypothetical protein KAI52_00370 [Candidatus Parcubacteria bacterium]|nr:hypothetical protein [Candidatus Parcubacteria bacterium]